MHLLNRITTGISIAVFVACCAAFVLFGMASTGWEALTIPTGSMRPGMPPGSLALMHRAPDASLKVGDIITYANPRHPGTTVSHRIVKKYLVDGRVPGFVTKGDANQSADLPVVAGAIDGKIVWHVPYVGAWLLWAKSWTGLAVLVYAPALLIIIEEMLRLAAYYKSLEPYRLFGYRFVQRADPGKWAKKLTVGSGAAAAVIFAASILAPQAYAQLISRPVTLTHNVISAATVTPPPGTHTCSGNTANNSTITVNNSSTQTATSGGVRISGNTTGGNATSGTAGNTNSTTVNITITNC
jgi:signal peptidase I